MFLSMKNVVVTGAGGFLGGHLVNYFLSQGANVIAVFYRETAESFEHTTKRQSQKNELQARILPEHQPRLTFFDGDITSHSDMSILLQENQPDTLIHAAALLVPPKKSDYLDPIQYQQASQRFVEINKAEVLADCVAHYQKQHDLYCLLVSTIYVFNLKSPIINEETEHLSLNLYATSKDESQRYWESKVSGLAIIYPPQIYGSHQFTPAIMSRLIRKMLFDESAQLTISGVINPVHVNNLIKLIYSLCLTAEAGPFCVNGDGLLTLEQVAHSLQSAAQTLLERYNILPNAAFVVSNATSTTSVPQIDASRLTQHIKAHNPDYEPPQPIDFTTTATEMVWSHWRHNQKTNHLMGLNFFGMKFSDCFDFDDVFTDLLRKASQTDNVTIKEVLCKVKRIWIPSGRTTVLGANADGLKREFNLSDDPGRIYFMIYLARVICALKANKELHELTDDDIDIEIIYNGRAIHNQDFRKAIARGYFNYPAHLFKILDIYPENTLGQIASLREYWATQALDDDSFTLCGSDPYHNARVALLLSHDSPQVSNGPYQFIIKSELPDDLIGHKNTYFFIRNEKITKLYYIGYTGTPKFVRINNMQKFEHALIMADIIHNDIVYSLSYEDVITLVTLNNSDHLPEVNPLSLDKFLIVGFGKNEKRCGIEWDIPGEYSAMKNYSSGLKPSISRYQGSNVFFTNADLLARKSFNDMMRWGNRRLHETDLQEDESNVRFSMV